MISNAASEMVHPAINPETEILKLPDEKRVLVITIREGLSKPYFDKDGVIWVKNGADKRRITAREELLRMFQSENYLHADELPVNGLTVSDIDLPYFASIYNKMYNESLDNQQLSLSQLLENMNLMTDEYLNLTGALCFSSRVSYFRPMFIVKAVRYPGTDINMETYMDSRDFSGKLEDVYNGTLGFILSNVPYSQDGQDVNSIARSTVPRIVFEELLVNALTHRDYFVSGAIRVFMFDNRMEIISPGCLPNSLTIANIKAGNSVCRNPILSSYTRYILPYRGLGNGIRRAFQAYQNIGQLSMY